MVAPEFDIHTLLDPAMYPWPVDEVVLIETHISWVLLAGDRVVKLKRPVDLGFVDFRDPARRKQACDDEVRLNRKLTTGVYLGVVPITAHGIEGSGEPLEWAVLMRRMPADRMLDVLIREDNVPDDLADLLAEQLIPFHSASLPGSSLAFDTSTRERGEVFLSAQNDDHTMDDRDGTTRDCPADPDIYLSILTENLDQLASAAGDVLGREQLRLVDRSIRQFMATERDRLEKRLERWLGEGHGDLRCEHICLEDNALQIYDCVEFEIAIRCADVASDLAFLLMDLRRLGAGSTADELLQRYRAAGFTLPQPVIDLYAAHRALVRSKVVAMARSGEPEHDLALAFESGMYLDLASAYVTPTKPMAILVSGLSGSGKSTVAAALGRITNGSVLSSDLVRKHLVGIEATESAAAEWHQGIYTGEWTDRTYDRLLELAIVELDKKRAVVVDATFLDNDRRERFVAAARDRSIPAAIIWTDLNDAVARERIEHRARERNSPSDATIAIREHQQTRLREHPLHIPAGALDITIDTSRNGPASLDPFFSALQKHTLIGML